MENQAGTLTKDEQALLSQFGEKKRPKKTAAAAGAEEPAAEAAAADGERDFTYEEMLARIFRILTEKNPEHGTRSQPIFIKTPTVGREGKKTVWFNFGEICKQFVPQPSHKHLKKGRLSRTRHSHGCLLDFLCARTQTTG